MGEKWRWNEVCDYSHMKEILSSVNIYNTLAFLLLCRERDEKFTDIENEFRIIAYAYPVTYRGKVQQKPRETTIYGKQERNIKECWKPRKIQYLQVTAAF